ncbi:MAG: Type phosphodiesterase / nucleotide pyrophosphatase [Cyanobacteria bacterium RYN_339]|nr:Type phosphodiesterase / nucleotide pyrophosphatase [Cyanobacteria bacterium RYN_339]
MIAWALAAALATPPKLVVLEWEGGGSQLVRRLLAEGAMPHLAALVARGAVAEEARPPFVRGRLAAGAALWTGAAPDVSGVTGGYVPLAGRSILEGHPADVLAAASLPEAAATAGRQVVAVDLPWRPAGAAALTIEEAVPLDERLPDDQYGAEIMTRLARHRHAVVAAMKARSWDVFTVSLALPARAEARWWGIVVPGTPAADGAAAVRVWPRLRQVCQGVDLTIGALADALPPGAVFAVVGERGLTPTRWTFHPNVALRRAGLLALDRTGQVDLAHTEVMYGPTNGGFLLINTLDRPGGIVDPVRGPAVVNAARRALLEVSVKTLEGVRPVVRAALPPGPGTGTAGVLYLGLQPGYDMDAQPTGEALFSPRPPATSAGDGSPEEPGFLAVIGPGLAPRGRMAAISTLDVAPTLARLIGLPPLKDARGRVLTELLRSAGAGQPN